MSIASSSRNRRGARRARIHPDPVSRISRQHLTEPAYGPIEFELRDVRMVGASLTGTAMVRNLQKRRFPRLNKNYDYIQFPSLLPT